MKKRGLLGMFLMVFMVLFVLQGFTQQSINLGVVNPQKTIENSKAGRQALSQIQAKEQAIRKELSSLDSRIFDLEKRYNTQRLTLSTEAQQKMLFDMENLKIDRQRREEDLGKEYQSLRVTLLNRIWNEINPIISDIAKEKGLAMVFDLSTGGVLYFDQAFDITDEVIRRYNNSRPYAETILTIAKHLKSNSQ